MSSEFRPDWKAYKLDELGFVGRGKSRHRPRNDPSLYGGSYPFFQTGDVKAANFYLKEYSQTYNEKGLAQSKLWNPGTLCITIAANIAETAILSIEGCFPDSIVGFIPDNSKADGHFIKYYLDTIKLRIQNVSHGATQDNLSLDKLALFDIVLPPLPTQHKIASILSAYDDLIENNTRRIKILEEIAQTIYNGWFVKFRFPGHENVKMVNSELGMIPEGWEVKKLSEVADINSASIKKGMEPSKINYIDISSVSTGTIDKIEPITFTEAPSRARRIVKHGDIVWSTVRPNRKSYSIILNPMDNLIVSTGFAVITPNKVPYTYLYHALTTDEFVGYLVNNATGAAYPAVNSKDFQNAVILRPSNDILSEFHSKIEAVFELKHNFTVKNENLHHTRDLLLPRLISGEIDVSTLDINMGEITA